VLQLVSIRAFLVGGEPLLDPDDICKEKWSVNFYKHDGKLKFQSIAKNIDAIKTLAIKASPIIVNSFWSNL